MKATRILLGAAVVILVGSVAAIGYFYGRSVGNGDTGVTVQQAGAGRQFQGQQGGQFTPPGGALPGGLPQASGGAGTAVPGRGATMGTIKEICGNTLIVTTADSEVQVDIGADTQITGTAQVALTDLKTGQRISVVGQAFGSTVTANSISVFADVP